ncbi:hypothetical protein PGT21_002158 [Puccinia graminis f. sp. tritici]|uniref:Restriction of telomere capping protein 4 n=2 Tax=Puccinia graminis f. sp. tritici TaxID=56615 RepID=A0A5B0PVT9_PUCGR|nr:hypothetical protein PGT21_002158 [Puccinia graminis f. sp. tritici]KAA1105113.1 hypothetical protein PGTUg99_012603 [Puccinia graminis f. sp. tritici]
MSVVNRTEALRQLHFKKIKNRTPTPIAMPTARTRPPTGPSIDLTGIEQASPPSRQKRPPNNRPFKPSTSSSPFKQPARSTNPNPPKQPSTQSQKNQFKSNKHPPSTSKPPNKKLKTTQLGVKPPKNNTSNTLQNRPLPEILGKSRPAPLTSTSSPHLSVNKTHSICSGSTRASSSTSRLPNTDTDSSRPASTSKTPFTRYTIAPYSDSPPPSKPSSARKKLLDSNDTKDRASTLSCLSDLHIPTRSPSSDSVSIVSKPPQNSPLSTDLIADVQSTLSSMGMASQTDRCPRTVNYRTPDFHQSIHEDSPLVTSPIVDNPASLCPFCDKPLPENPSAGLVKHLEYLKNQPGVKRRKESKNPSALYLPFPMIANYCQRHRAEKQLIPMGLAKGWPSKIDFKTLPNRITSHLQYLNKICTREIASDFLDMALEEWSVQGPRKAQSVINEFGTFQIEQPGYYGSRGWEVICHTLKAIFLSPSRCDWTLEQALPLTPEFLLLKVLVPETALCLIADDLKLGVKDARVRTTLEESRTFGTVMFPDEDDKVPTLSDGRSSSESESEEQSSLQASHPKQLRLNKKRPRKSDSCEIEIVPSKRKLSSQRSRRQSGSSDQRRIDKIKPSSRSDRNLPRKRYGGDRNRPIYPTKVLNDGWEPTLC